MADEIISRDENHVTVGAGVSPDSDLDISMLRVDPVTKKLLVYLSDTAASSANAVQIAKRDENHRPVCMAWDETNQCLQEILTDSNGNLLCDVLIV
jgi:hypothetical protein